MDTRTLRYFLVTAQERNFTKAANKLCMAQPPLSRQIKLLEEELGVTLFIRNSRQLQLTEEGYFLKQQAEVLPFPDPPPDRPALLPENSLRRRLYIPAPLRDKHRRTFPAVQTGSAI